jgi:quercetin dioxygenase-like cupin family protein
MANPKKIDYFAFDPASASKEKGRFVAIDSDLPMVEFTKGLYFRPLLGKNVLVNFVRYEPHTEAPLHVHTEEQIAFVLEGEFEFEVAGDKRIMRPGDAVWVPPMVPHAARTGEHTCYQVDVFNPPRQALLELMDRAKSLQ